MKLFFSGMTNSSIFLTPKVIFVLSRNKHRCNYLLVLRQKYSASCVPIADAMLNKCLIVAVIYDDW